MREAVDRELAALALRDADLAGSVLATSLRVMAIELDDPSNSATSKSMCVGKLLEAARELRELSPPAVAADRIDEVNARRERRRQAVAGLADAEDLPGS